MLVGKWTANMEDERLSSTCPAVRSLCSSNLSGRYAVEPSMKAEYDDAKAPTAEVHGDLVCKRHDRRISQPRSHFQKLLSGKLILRDETDIVFDVREIVQAQLLVDLGSR